MRIIQKFKEKLGALNLKNILASGLESPSSTPLQNHMHSSSVRGSMSGQMSKSSNISNSSLALLDSIALKQKIKKNECCYLLQKPHLFNTLKDAFLDEKYLKQPKVLNLGKLI